MIPNLEHKANNEKYFKSIRYFSHSLKGEKRRTFIAKVAAYNIYLAAQCIMSAEKDTELENRLIEKAQSIAQNFSQPENSAKGFLALAEFESLDIISSLFSSIKKPSSIHLQVITKILENKPSDVFCSFLIIFMKTDKPILVQFAINGYNNEIILTNTNILNLRTILNYFIKNRLFGLLGVFLTKFNLISDFSYIINKKIDEIIRQISNSKFTGTKLAYKLAVENNLINDFTPEYFIKKAASRGNKRSMLLALSIANEYDIKKINELDKLIEANILRNKKNDITRLKFIGKKIIMDYISNTNVDLLEKVNSFFEENTKKRIVSKNDTEQVENIEKIVSKNDTEQVENIVDISIESDIRELLYKSKRSVYRDKELVALQEKWGVSLMEISHLLRVYELQGVVKRIINGGYYVRAPFRTKQFLFLHKDQTTEKQEVNHPNKVLKKGDLITFRIIGIDSKTHRLNISCLDRFIPENNGVNSFFEENTEQVENVIDISIESDIRELLYKSKRSVYRDKELVALQEKWGISLMEISHLLRAYELQGVVKYIMNHGCYVEPPFSTKQLLFLHKDQTTEKQEVNHPSEVLKKGDLITFRIIGINPKTHRLNISCLDRFIPEKNGVSTGE